MSTTLAAKPETTEEAAKEEPTLRYRGWKAMPYVIGNETFEKLGTIGTSANLLVYLTTIFHMESATATTLLSVFNGTTNLSPVFGAFLSDTYFGRYWTLGFASVSSLLGMLILTLTAAIPKLHPPRCTKGQLCAMPRTGQLTVLLSAFAFLVVGAGGIRPCNLAFGADQFDPRTDSGRKGITSFFNWYYFTFTFAMMVSSTIIIYVQSDVSWSLGLAIPTLLMFFSCAFFFTGTRIYVRVKPEGSPFASIARVIVAAFKKRGLEHPDDPRGSLFNPSACRNSLNSKLPYTDQFRFLEKAAIVSTTDEIESDGSATNPWRLSTLQQVEEVKCLLRITPIWSAGILYAVAVFQSSSYVVFQALQSDRHLGHSNFEIPAGSFSVFSMLALTIWIPIYDRILVPRLQRITGNEGGITMLQRIGVGMVFAIIAMAVSACVEERRRSMANSSPGSVSTMSSLWLVPQLAILGLSEGFSLIGQVEFYYKQFPENMRSVAGSVVFLSSAMANYLSGLMITVIHRTTGGDGKSNWLDGDLNKGKLDYFYYLIAVIGVLNFMYFITCAKWYRYKVSETGAEISLEANKTNGSLV